MNWSTIQDGWDGYKANVKQQWSKLTDEQITGTLGKRENLSSRVQEAYALSKEDTERQITAWLSQQVEKPATS